MENGYYKIHLLILTSILILLLSTSLAQENSLLGNATLKINDSKVILENISNSFNSRVNLVFQSELKIPTYLDKPSRILFGVKEGNLFNLQILLILSSFFLFFVVIIYEFSTILNIPRGPIAIIFAFVFTGILSWTGSFYTASDFLVKISGNIAFLRDYSFISIILSIMILLIIYATIGKFAEKFISGKRIADAEDDGLAVGAQVALTKARAEIVRKK